tara:strand:+ start:2022 stop:2432 length:411 start_codon:yes stop_codon:yes gene_type:complete
MTVAITEVRNAASLQSDNLRMEVEINHPIHGWIPYGIDPTDTDNTINNDEVMALIGTDFAAYVAPTQDQLSAALAAEVRADRDERLTEVDAVAGNALRWSELDAETQAAWAAYRQALLDVPQQAGFPNTVTWPTKP